MSARGRGVDAEASYFAGALSLVFHPCSPYVPTFRSDIRYFAVFSPVVLSFHIIYVFGRVVRPEVIILLPLHSCAHANRKL
jgi:coproporphyrinogen III oxidase